MKKVDYTPILQVRTARPQQVTWLAHALTAWPGLHTACGLHNADVIFPKDGVAVNCVSVIFLMHLLFFIADWWVPHSSPYLAKISNT